MRKYLLIAAVAATGMLAFASCRKESKTTLPPSTNTDNAKQFIEKHRPKTQTFILNVANLPQTITLAGGTKVTIPTGITVSGQPVTGNITVEAIEVLKRSDVLKSGTNTNTIDGALLTSQGFIYVNVRSNGMDADNALLNPLHIVIPGTPGDSTFIWQGNTNVDGTNQLGWNLRNGALVKAGLEGFEFDFGNLGWVNCDMLFAINLPKTTMHVSLVNNPGELATFMGQSGNTYVFLCVQGSNVAAQLYTPDGNGVKSYDNSIPIGVSAKLLSFCIKDGHYYLAEKEIATVANETDELTLTETTEEDIQLHIDALNDY